MISKFANNEAFGNDMFSDMSNILIEQYGEDLSTLTKSASVGREKLGLSKLMDAVATIANTLDETGHPIAKDATLTLSHIAKIVKVN